MSNDIDSQTVDDNADEVGPEAPTGDVALIGEAAHGGTQVSMQVLQNIYQELTGGSEELGKGYDRPFCIHLNDLEQLHRRFQQATEQYNIRSANCTVKLYHTDDTHETYRSFESFLLYSKAGTSAVESILIKYNLLIVLPKLKKAQSYTISIRIASRVAILKRLRDNASSFPKSIFRLMGGQTATVSIDYIDFTVARNLLTIADGWFDSLQTSRQSWFLRKLKTYSEWFSTIAKLALGAAGTYLAYSRLPVYLNDHDTDLLALARVLILSFVFIFFMYQLGRTLGKKAEYAIVEIHELSFINLNRGDENLIEDTRSANWLLSIKAIFNAFLAFALSIAASLVANSLS